MSKKCVLAWKLSLHIYKTLIIFKIIGHKLQLNQDSFSLIASLLHRKKKSDNPIREEKKLFPIFRCAKHTEKDNFHVILFWWMVWVTHLKGLFEHPPQHILFFGRGGGSFLPFLNNNAVGSTVISIQMRFYPWIDKQFLLSSLDLSLNISTLEHTQYFIISVLFNCNILPISKNQIFWMIIIVYKKSETSQLCTFL